MRMPNLYCPICKSKKIFLIWNNKIRSGVTELTKEKRKIYRCGNCDISFLKKRYESLPDDAILRKIKDKKKIRQLLNFHAKRELPKLKKIVEVFNYNKKKVLLVNCDFGLTILDVIKKKASLTAGIAESENSFYIKDYLRKKKHKFFKSLDQIKSKNLKFDVIISPAQIEHVFNPNIYLKKFRKVISKKGVIILRIPNHDNIYKYVLNQIYLRKDYRISHNFYFSEKSCDFLFKKNKFKIIKKVGLMEHDINNLLNYIRLKRRPMQFEIKTNKSNKLNLYLNKKDCDKFTKNLEESPLPSHFIYVIKPY